MAVIECAHCGAETLDQIRGRRRRYCSPRCRHAAHRRRGRRTSGPRRTSAAATVTPQPGGLAAWAAWVRESYQIDRTGDELLRLIVEADVRYRQARDVLDAEGLTRLTADGRALPRPEVAIERDTRAAIARLITQLDLAEDSDHEQAEETPDVRRFPARVV